MFAYIDNNNKVGQVSETEVPLAESDTTGKWVEFTGNVPEIGWSYVDGVFVPPSLNTIRDERMKVLSDIVNDPANKLDPMILIDLGVQVNAATTAEEIQAVGIPDETFIPANAYDFTQMLLITNVVNMLVRYTNKSTGEFTDVIVPMPPESRTLYDQILRYTPQPA